MRYSLLLVLQHDGGSLTECGAVSFLQLIVTLE